VQEQFSVFSKQPYLVWYWYLRTPLFYHIYMYCLGSHYMQLGRSLAAVVRVRVTVWLFRCAGVQKFRL